MKVIMTIVQTEDYNIQEEASAGGIVRASSEHQLRNMMRNERRSGRGRITKIDRTHVQVDPEIDHIGPVADLV